MTNYKFCLYNENGISIDDVKIYTTCLFSFEYHILNYCVLELRDKDIFGYFLARHGGEICINNLILNEKNYNINGIDIFSLYKKHKFFQEIDWIENEECSKMMLCDYTSESIEEYLKSLL